MDLIWRGSAAAGLASVHCLLQGGFRLFRKSVSIITRDAATPVTCIVQIWVATRLNALPPVMIVGIVTACVRWPFRVTAQLTGSVELPKLGRFLRGISQVLNFLDHVVIFGGSIFVNAQLLPTTW